jgi:hypothetical protein
MAQNLWVDLKAGGVAIFVEAPASKGTPAAPIVDAAPRQRQTSEAQFDWQSTAEAVMTGYGAAIKSLSKE